MLFPTPEQRIRRQLTSGIGGTIHLPLGTLTLTEPLVVTSNNVTIAGYGSFNAGSIIHYHGTGDAIRFENCQYSSLKNVFIIGGGVSITNGFQCCIDTVRIDDSTTGVSVMSSTETDIRNLTLRNLTGSYGILVAGVDGAPSYRTVLDNIRADNPDNGNADTAWILVDSYAHTIVIDKAALLHGKHAIWMQDRANRPATSGSGMDSFARWVFATDLEADHNYQDAVKLEAGEGAFISSSWLGSSITGHGIIAMSQFRGEVALSTTRIMGNNQSGMRIVAAGNYTLSSCFIGDNGTQGIDIDNPQAQIAVSACVIGDVVGSTGNNQQYGIYVNAGHLTESANIINGNRTGGIRLP